jgi:hypothetical protein
MDPKGKGIVINDKEKESFINEPKDDKPTDPGSSHKKKDGKKKRRIKKIVYYDDSDESSSSQKDDDDNDYEKRKTVNSNFSFDYCRRFEIEGSMDRRVNCRRVPQPRRVGARWSAKGGGSRRETGVRGGNPAAFVFVPCPGRVRLQ